MGSSVLRVKSIQSGLHEKENGRDTGVRGREWGMKRGQDSLTTRASVTGADEQRRSHAVCMSKQLYEDRRFSCAHGVNWATTESMPSEAICRCRTRGRRRTKVCRNLPTPNAYQCSGVSATRNLRMRIQTPPSSIAYPRDWRVLWVAILWLQQAIFLAVTAIGQCPERWVPSLGLSGGGGSVNAIAHLPNGDWVVGGTFSAAGSETCGGIAIYSPSTGRWTALGSGVAGTQSPHINAVLAMPDNSIVVGGYFGSIDSVPAYNVARWNPATSSWSMFGSGLSGEVMALALLPSGDIVAGGSFAFIAQSGYAVFYITRWNAGSNTWEPLGAGMNNQVNALAALPNGDLVAGGTFTMAGGVAAPYLARWDTEASRWMAVGSRLNGPVRAVALLPSGDIAVGGSFSFVTTVGGTTRANGIVRWNWASSSWNVYGTGIGGTVRAIGSLPNGNVVAGGEFAFAGGAAAANAGMWNNSANAWVDMGQGVDDIVKAVVVQSVSEVVMGGAFAYAGEVVGSSIATYTVDSNTWASMGGGVSDLLVFAITPLPNGDAIVGGNFLTADGVAVNRIARWNNQSNSWSPLGLGVNNSVWTVCLTGNGDLVVGGRFTVAGIEPAAHIARYRSATNSWSGVGGGTNEQVLAIVEVANGNLFVGGAFTVAGGVPASYFARWESQTNSWANVGVGADSWVTSLSVRTNNEVVLSGSFTRAGGVVGSVIRYDWANNTWSTTGPESNGGQLAQVIDRFGDVIVAGGFTSIGGIEAKRIARWSSRDSTWSALGGGIPGGADAVFALAALPNGDILAGGRFSVAGASQASNIAKWSRATNSWTALGSGLTGTPYSSAYRISVLPNGDVLAGGTFRRAGNQSSPGLARWSMRPICSADFDCSGLSEPSDLFWFLNAWFANDLSADVDDVVGLGISDVFAFVQAWIRGCF